MGDLERPFPNANVLLDRVVDICPFPATAQRLMILVNDEGAPIDAIASAVQCDPALATQVLRVANSAAFRPAGSDAVRDLRQGLVTVGLGELRMMAGAMALLATFATRDELSLDLHRTSAVSGSIAEAIVPLGPGVTRSLPYLCGLLCEVGALACLAVDGPGYVELWQRTVNSNGGRWSPEAVTGREALEIKRYGIASRTIAARLLRRHHLPPEIASAIETAPGSSPTVPLFHRATAFARIATLLVVEALRTRDSAALKEQIGEVARITSLVELDVDELARRCLLAATTMEKTLRAARD
ncbi:MAG TPA: HDOD domain-containing protein [Polyangiaceae bacterium]|nr:HDOD domain-containing protein [Polyangiaceae bacterium]